MDKQDNEIYLNDMQIEEKGVSMQLSGSPLHILADAFVEQFKETGAENYLEIKFIHRDTQELYTLTVQKVTGLTPADKVAQLEAENTQLRKRPEFDLSTVHGREQAVIANLRRRGL